MIELKRLYFPEFTLGFMVRNGGEVIASTLELPDLNNETNVSCIPEGIYHCTWIESPSLGWCYNVADVYGRTFIRIHSGNYTSEILGCILVGDGHKDINGDQLVDVTNSKKTLEKIHNMLGDSFTLQIK
ncbi:TPA: hypothetical protein P0E12_004963 [Vibrio harveyi]|nr:hypothetical protein [Vibrio harveyi]